MRTLKSNLHRRTRSRKGQGRGGHQQVIEIRTLTQFERLTVPQWLGGGIPKLAQASIGASRVDAQPSAHVPHVA